MSDMRMTPGPRSSGRLRSSGRTGAAAILVAVVAGLAAGCGSSGGGSSGSGSSGGANPASESATQVITDTAGRQVRVPRHISRIVTVGFPPVSDGWIIALGAKNLIVNGFPGYSDTAFYRSDQLLIPGLASRPNVESALGGPVSPESLLADKPDVAITSDAATAEQISKLGVPALDINYLSSGPAMEHDVTVLGQLLGRQKQAAAYVSYFNAVIDEVHGIAAKIPPPQRLSAIYLAMDPLQRPNLIMTWMLGVLNVRDVTAGVGMTASSNLQFSAEQLYRWNPDVIIGHDPADVPALLTQPQFRQLAAVKNKRVNVIPEGVNTWGDNTVEQPLGLLWTAKDIYPKQFAGVDLVARTRDFYSRFFGVKLSDGQATDLITSQNGL